MRYDLRSIATPTGVPMSNSQKLASELTQLENRSTEYTQKIREAITACRPHVVNHAVAWIQGQVTGAVAQHPEQVQQLGLERLRELKARVKELEGSIPKIVEQLTSNKDGAIRYTPQSSEDYFSDVFRRAISRLGAILNTYGIIETPGAYPSWLPANAHGDFTYAINTGFDPHQVEAMTQCLRLIRQHDDVLAEIIGKKDELTKAKAKELWESA